jgi:hypothetical protein
MRLNIRTVVCGVAALVVFSAASASAQYQPYRPSAGSSDSWHVEFALGTWQPPPALTVTVGTGSLAGTVIDVKNDLGVQSKLIQQYSLVLKPTKRFKFRFGYEPSSYSATVNIARTVVFNGQTFTATTPVTTTVNWKTYRIGYEVDFISRSRVFAGFITEGRYDQASVGLSSPQLAEAVRIRIPAPMLGGIVRVYPAKILSLTGEITGFSVPQALSDATSFDGDWFNLDLYATVNIGRYLGIRSGYRSTKITYTWNDNSAHMEWKGPYAAAVVRF